MSLDIEQPEQLIAYLRETGRIGPQEAPRVNVLAGGVSNRTVLVERPSGEGWVLKQALAKLRVKVDWFSDPARVHREALGLRWLSQLARGGYFTEFVFEDFDHHILAMSAVPQPHENWKTLLLRGECRVDHFRMFGRMLGQIHRGSWERRDEVAILFDDRSFFESLRLEPYYQYTAEQVPDVSGFFRQLIEQARATRLALVHGDFSPKNVLVWNLAGTDSLVLLDHEVIHFGDPAFDIGFSLAHFLSKTHHLVSHRSMLEECTHVYFESYREELGKVPWRNTLEPRAVNHALGCLLARVSGRSTLEYLSAEERMRQQRVVIALMKKPPRDVWRLVRRFVLGVTDGND